MLAEQQVEAAAALRRLEDQTSQDAQRLADLQATQQAASAQLQTAEATLEKLLPVMQRLSAQPAETLLAAPQSPQDAVRGIAIMQGVAAAIAAQAQQVKTLSAQVAGVLALARACAVAARRRRYRPAKCRGRADHPDRFRQKRPKWRIPTAPHAKRRPASPPSTGSTASPRPSRGWCPAAPQTANLPAGPAARRLPGISCRLSAPRPWRGRDRGQLQRRTGRPRGHPLRRDGHVRRRLPRLRPHDHRRLRARHQHRSGRACTIWMSRPASISRTASRSAPCSAMTPRTPRASPFFT